jgi:hypothetical protein
MLLQEAKVRTPVFTRRTVLRVAGRSLALLAAFMLVGLGVGPASAGSVVLVQEDVVTGGAASFPQANGWGSHGDRFVRASNGDLYTVYVTDGTDVYHRGWVLAKRARGSAEWERVAAGVTAYEPGDPPMVLLGRDETVFVVVISSWDSAAAGAPVVWDSRSRRTERIPGRWLTGAAMREAGALYPSASVDVGGNLYVWEDVPCPLFGGRTSVRCQSANVPGTYYWAYRTAGDGRWHAEEWQNAFRQTYNFLLPRGPGDLWVVGTRDVLNAEAGYACSGGVGYCFDQVVLSRWRRRRRPAWSTVVARAAERAVRYAGGHRASAEDAYVDTHGRAHVLVSVVDSTTHGAWKNYHLVIDRDGRMRDIQYSSVPYPNLSRITQDASGRFWLYSVGPDPANGHRCEVFIAGGAAGDTDGTRLGPVSVIPFAGRYDCATEDRNFDVSPRSGTALANYIDGVLATNGGRDWVHYRIALPTQAPLARRNHR